MSFALASPAFAEGERIPRRYTCEGEDISPPLQWTGTPAETRSLALICSDPDAPVGTWYHWGVFDIPADAGELKEAYPKDAAVGATRQAVTDFKRTGYCGPCPPKDHGVHRYPRVIPFVATRFPCPPKGHGVHRYRFHLMALGVDRLSVPASPDCREVERAAKARCLAEAVLTGTYSR